MDTIKINDVDYPFLDGSLSIEGALGVEGYTLSWGVPPGAPHPPIGGKVEWSGGGISFVGRLVDDGRQVRPGHATGQCTARTPTNRLADKFEYKARYGSVGDALNQLVMDTPFGGQIIGPDRVLYGVSLAGNKLACLQELAAWGYRLHIGPGLNIELIHREEPPDAPFDLVYGETPFLTDLDARPTVRERINQIRATGGVPKKDDDDEEEEEMTQSFSGSGAAQDFIVDRLADELLEVDVGGDVVEAVTWRASGWESAPLVWYPSEYRLHFSDPPASGTPITVKFRVRRATFVLNDLAAQATEAALFGGSGVISEDMAFPSLRTVQELQQRAEIEMARRNQVRWDATAKLRPGAPPFVPGRVSVVGLPLKGFSGSLPIQRVRYGWRFGLIEQEINLGNGEDGETPGSPSGLVRTLRGPIGNSAGKQPPTNATQPGIPVPSFTLSADPATIEVAAGTTDAVEFPITVTPENGFTGVVRFEHTFGNEYEVEFDPATVTGSGITTCRVTPADGEWTDPDEDVSANVTGYSANVEPATVTLEIDVTSFSGNTGSYDFGACRVTDPLPYGLTTAYEWRLTMGGDYTGAVNFTVVSFDDGAERGNASAPISYTLGTLANIRVGDVVSLLWHPQPAGWNQEAYARLVFMGEDEEGGQQEFTITLQFGVSDPSVCL